MFLGINTAFNYIGLGLTDDYHVLSDLIISPQDYSFSENLIIEIEKFLSLNQVSFSDLKAVGLVNGPGSYTGLRVGTTLVNTLAQVRKIAVYSINTLEALAYQYRDFDGVYFVLIPACQGEVNVQMFGVNQQEITALSDEMALKIEVFLQKITSYKGDFRVIGSFDKKILLTDHSPEVAEGGPTGILKGLAPLKYLLISEPLRGLSLAKMAREKFFNQEKIEKKTILPKYSHLPNVR